MNRYEYMRIPTKNLPRNIIEQYYLESLIIIDYVMVEIRKEMYGLPQAGIIANKRLLVYLYQHGYIPCPHNPGLFKYNILDTMFTVVVDNFDIKSTQTKLMPYIYIITYGPFIP